MLAVTLPARKPARYAGRVTTSNTAGVPETTIGVPAYAQSDRELLEAIYVRLEVLETELSRLLTAWSAGGLRGLRAAAKTGGQ